MRIMSCSLTTDAVVERRKWVTRRMGWATLQVGELLCLVRKAMGRKRGEPLERLAVIRITDVSVEQLASITPSEVELEGFTGWTPAQFVEMFVASHKGATAESLVTVVRWRFEETAFRDLFPDDFARIMRVRMPELYA